MNGSQKFQIHRDDRSTDRLPAAHTCFNQLDLPAYEVYIYIYIQCDPLNCGIERRLSDLSYDLKLKPAVEVYSVHYTVQCTLYAQIYFTLNLFVFSTLLYNNIKYTQIA